MRQAHPQTQPLFPSLPNEPCANGSGASGAEFAADDLSLCLWPGFVPARTRDALLTLIHDDVPWTQHRIRIHGRELPSPRLSAWIGDPGCAYTYSKTRFEPLPWTPALAGVRAMLADELGLQFNSVLCNLYRDGADSMGWHSDDERELGHEPVIASLSLGQPRRFLLRSKAQPRRTLELELGDGSLLIMRGATQAHWQHALPKSLRVKGARINLTFRNILPAD